MFIAILSFQEGFEVASKTMNKRMKLTARGIGQKPSLSRMPHLSIALAVQFTSRGTRKQDDHPWEMSLRIRGRKGSGDGLYFLGLQNHCGQ